MTVIPFDRAKARPAEEVLRYEIEIYDAEGRMCHLVARRPDGESVDVHDLTQALSDAVFANGLLSHEARLLIMFGRTEAITVAIEGTFETPEQLAWLRRRWADTYWQIDTRKGIGRALHTLSRFLSRLTRAHNKETDHADQ